MKKVLLETPRLILKTIPTSYASKVLDFYSRNKDFLEPFEPARSSYFYTRAHQKQMLKWDLEGLYQSASIRLWIFDKKYPSRPIGTVALSNIVRGIFQSCHLGYKMDKEYLRLGYMFESLQAVTQHAFESMHLHRIEANIMPKNRASLELVRKLGFQEEGLAKEYLKINDIWEDHYHMVLINSEKNIDQF